MDTTNTESCRLGSTNAPATCQSLINDTLREHLDTTVIAYLDDILIYTDGSQEQHVRDVQAVLEKLKEKRLQLCPDKCEFHKKEVDFLGFIVGVNGIKLDPNKVKSIREWPQPTCVKDIQAFLGLANYNREFIKDYSKIATPLTYLTKKDVAFNWTAKQEQAFQALKDACASAPVRKMFDGARAIQIETDASDYAIGAVITQEYDGKRHPVAYYSRKLSPAEQNYDIHDKELLAIVAALQHWRIYSEGALGVDIYSDHKNLLHFTTTKILNRRQVRWSELLGQHKFTIHYTPGRDNARADALSRRPDYLDGKDPEPQQILKQNADGTLSPNVKELNAILTVLRDDEEHYPIVGGRCRIPPEQEQDCIRRHHDDLTAGHPGVAKTLDLLRRNFIFPDMKNKVERFIKKCSQCQRNKADRHREYGAPQAIPVPSEPWEQTTMDFITGLPLSEDPVTGLKYDSILVMVDRLTKYSHYIPCNKSLSADQLAHLVLDRLVRYNGIPKNFITDRDKLFTSNYWKTLVAGLGIKHRMSTAYHPQTDGQIERMNQTLEVYLRSYLNFAQDNWVQLLPMAQLSLNNLPSATTKKTPFFALHGTDPNLFMEPRQGTRAEWAENKIARLKATHKEINDNITRTQNRVISNSKKTEPQLRRGDKVYLRTKNLKTRRKSKKLDHVKVGPFSISEVIGPVNYRLQLPADARIHPVFHISLLEPADPETPVQKTFHYEPEGEDEFIVESILQQRGQHYLVKWKGYPSSDNTWEPKRHLTHCRQALRTFHQKQRK